MVQDLDSERISAWKRAKLTSIEWLAVIISCTATVIALISMFVCAISIALVISQERHINDLSGDIDVYRIRAAKLNAYLAARGINTEEIYND